MTEQDRKDKHITCSRCKCKYTNDDEYIKNDFGYNRLIERHKTCAKCRCKQKQYCEDNEHKLKTYFHQYWVDNKDEITKKRETLKQAADASEGTILYCNRCYKNKSIDDFVCPNGKTYDACYGCLTSRYG